MKPKVSTLTQERLKHLLHYDPETGVFRWRETMGPKAISGSIAGCQNNTGRRTIGVDRGLYLEHRLAWLYMTGEWPEGDLDHENRNPADNRWVNLRPATQQENCFNQGLRKDNKSGVKGVWWDIRQCQWIAVVKHSGEKRHLGYFDDIDAAKQFIELFRNMFHGEFACNS